MENDSDLRCIHELLWHVSSKITEIYTHINFICARTD
ncbi:MAG: hypothetical protein HPY74_13700 [Firmicutes bacterium]|nr:hypothetical protein [Bacillota bacterium]